ncbi:hypothetical protein F5Y12DRAFT_769896 [Xylaria sp. FL1777]|nr:hypothetical protein F5Y12DRAFT_769896 [Xylaria sp. FL1777]
MATDPIFLNGLTPREEIADLLNRCCWAFDTNNKAMWESAWLEDPDITMELNGNVHKGLGTINKEVFDKVSVLDTQHIVSAIRINIVDDKTAHMTASAQNQHFRPGEGLPPTTPNFMAGSTYHIDVVKDETGAWKMIRFVLRFTWSQGDYVALFTPAAGASDEK